ncbi:MAG: hypothetical protein U1E77_19670 [Inhella sp.]
MLTKITTALICAALLAGCGGSSDEPARVPEVGATQYHLELGLQQPAYLPQEALQLQVVQIQDSRCRAPAPCAQPGSAAIQLEVALASPSPAPQRLELPLGADPIESGRVWGRYRFTLEALEPSPPQAEPQPADYRARLHIERLPA